MKKFSISTLSNKALTQYYKKILCHLTGYYVNNALYRFTYTSTGIALKLNTDSAFAPKSLIIAREYYQEKLVTYPIEDKKELRKLLALEFSEPSTHYQIVSQAEGVSQVNIWQFKPNLPSAKIVIPESVLLAQALHNNQLLIQQCLASTLPKNSDSNLKLYITHLNKGIVSAYGSQFINSPERFCNSIGISVSPAKTTTDTDTAAGPNNQVIPFVQASTTQHLPSALINGMINAPLALLLKFAHKPTASKSTSLLKATAWPAIVVVSLYLIISSVGLYWQQTTLQQQISEQKSDINQALNAQDQYNKDQTELKALSGFLQQQQAKSLVWLTLASIIGDVHIKTLRYSAGRYIMLGRTNKNRDQNSDPQGEESTPEKNFKSTDFLGKLIQLPLVTDAKFDSSVRRSTDYESFTVSFLLNSPAQTDSPSNTPPKGAN